MLVNQGVTINAREESKIWLQRDCRWVRVSTYLLLDSRHVLFTYRAPSNDWTEAGFHGMSYMKCHRCEEEAYADIIVSGRVDEESLNWLDRGLAKRLEFMCNLSIPSLTDIDIPPATKTLIFTPGSRTVLKTKATPSVLWALKTSWWTHTNGCCFA